MVPGIAQKSTNLYFHSGPFRKRYTEINLKKSCRGKIKSTGNNLDTETEKKVKLYLSYFA